MRPVEVSDDDVARIDALAEVAVIVELVQDLPADQRTAVLARIVDEGEYADIAVAQGVSEAVVRQRVSRGLAGLRRRWEKRIVPFSGASWSLDRLASRARARREKRRPA